MQSVWRYFSFSILFFVLSLSEYKKQIQFHWHRSAIGFIVRFMDIQNSSDIRCIDFIFRGLCVLSIFDYQLFSYYSKLDEEEVMSEMLLNSLPLSLSNFYLQIVLSCHQI